jgi:hypothetical protein
MMKIRVFFIVAVAVVCWAMPSAADKVSLSNRTSLSAEYDDNVFKASDDVEGDFLGRLFNDFRFHAYPTANNALLLNHQFGIKKYIEIDQQDTLINLARLGYTNTSIDNSFLGVEASLKVRNIRSGEEDYNKAIIEGFAGHEFGAGVTGQVRGGYTRFDFRSYNFYDYWLQRYGFVLQKTYGPQLIFGVHYFFQEKHFPFNAFENFGSESGGVFLIEKGERRLDVLHEPAVFLQASYWLLADFSYLLQINQSNSYGDSYYNHRFTLGLSKAIAKKTHLHLIGVAQLRDSSESVLIPHSYSIEEDDENYNSVALKITHRFTDVISMDVGYSRYWTSYSSRELNFVKNLYSIGVSASFK